MSRMNINNEYGEAVGCFNPETSFSIQEAKTFNGSNCISNATGSQWDHERLFLTKGGKWVLSSWSDWQGSTETCETIGRDQAFIWMMVNASDCEVAALPVTVQTEYTEFVHRKEL